MSGTEPTAVVESNNQRSSGRVLEFPAGDDNADIVLVDYEENDPENPLNWSPTQKWLIVFAISWMGFGSYMATKYALVSLIFATLTEIMETTYPNVFSRGPVGLTFLSLAIGNTVALVFYSLTSDRYIVHQQRKQGDAFQPESRLLHLFLAVTILPLGFLIYGWTMEFRVHYIAPLVGACVAGFSMALSTLPIETYVVDVYEIHAASAIAAGVIARAISGAFLPLIGPPLYQAIGLGWGNTVLAFIAAVFIPPVGLLIKYGDWFLSQERFGSSGR